MTRLSTVLGLLLYVVPALAQKPPAQPGDSLADELSARRARWQKDARQPAGAVAVAGAVELWALVEPRELAAFLAAAAGTPGANPLARAQARWGAEAAAGRLGDDARGREHRAAL